MAFRLTAELRRQLISDKSKGLSESSSPVEFVEASPISEFNLQFPGNVIPDFEKEKKAGMTIGAVFGHWTTESILAKVAEKIRAGQFRLKPKFAAKIGAPQQPTFSMGEAALCLFIRECYSAEDEATRQWAYSAAEAVASQLSMTKNDFERLPIGELERRLTPVEREPENNQPPEKSHGAQGQTKKPGSHSESRHR